MKVMFEKFGEFNSAEEINQAAAGLLDEGDAESILKLAVENGLDKEFAQAFIDGDIPVLTDSLMAAVGKLELERKNVKGKVVIGIIDDLVNYLMTSCSNEEFAKTVRMKGKTLQGCIDHCEKKLTEIAQKQRKGNEFVGLSVRNMDVYSMEKEYYMNNQGGIAGESI
jgi:hypothetical protein